MAIYFYTYALYFAILAIGLKRKNKRGWIIAATLPMFSLVLMRGYVGVDTPMYIQSIGVIQQNEGYIGLFEPGFEYLILALSYVDSDPMIVIKLIAIIITYFLLRTNWKTGTAYQVVALGIIPYYYFDMTMNGLRYGLAFAIILASLHSLFLINRTRFMSTALLAASIQVTSLYLTLVLHLQDKLNLKYALIIISMTAGIFIIGSEYFFLKISHNDEFSKPSLTSGIAPLFLSLVVLAGCWLSKSLQISYRKKILVLFALTFVTYGITQINYIGLRLQQLNYFLILIFLIYASEKSALENSKMILRALIIASVFGSAFRLNNFQNNEDVGRAPFNPYKFYWQE